ncbi:MAG: hypothetical protein QOE54_2601 [Streptosporangiaceae bacterium]|nr:hypothetical protein [Streptosporangiaceae bacterium]
MDGLLGTLRVRRAAQPSPPPDLAPTTVPETRRLLTALTGTTHTDAHSAIDWSHWRRRLIASVQTSHCKCRIIIESEHVIR